MTSYFKSTAHIKCSNIQEVPNTYQLFSMAFKTLHRTISTVSSTLSPTNTRSIFYLQLAELWNVTFIVIFPYLCLFSEALLVDSSKFPSHLKSHVKAASFTNPLLFFSNMCLCRSAEPSWDTINTDFFFYTFFNLPCAFVLPTWLSCRFLLDCM